MIDERKIREALKVVLDPELKRSLLELGMVREICVVKGQVSLTLALTTTKRPKKEPIVAEIERVLGDLPDVAGVDVKLTTLTCSGNSGWQSSAWWRTCLISSTHPEDPLLFLARAAVKN